MFDNIGGKVKGLTIFIMLAGFLISIILGAIQMADSFLAGLLIILIGCVVSWISSWITYAVGESAEQAANAVQISAECKEQLQQLIKAQNK